MSLKNRRKNPQRIDDLARIYFGQIKRPLLSGEEEIHHSINIKKAREAREELKQIDEQATELRQRIIRLKDSRNGNNDLLPGLKRELEMLEKEKRPFYDTIQTGEESYQLMVESNLKLVISVVKEYDSKEYFFSDLIQEGNLGLMDAVERFDHTRQVRFSTYAVWWIRRGILRGIDFSGNALNLSSHVNQRVRKVKKTEEHLFKKLHREPTADDLEEVLDMSRKHIEDALILGRGTVSLNTLVNDGDSELGDYLEDKTAHNPETRVYEESDAKEAYGRLHVLNSRENKVIHMRYAIGYDREYTLEEIGKFLGLTRERIRQIESEAMNKLRNRKNSSEKFPEIYREILDSKNNSTKLKNYATG